MICERKMEQKVDWIRIPSACSMKNIGACRGFVFGIWVNEPPAWRKPEIPNAKTRAEIFAVIDFGEKYFSRMK